MVQLCIIYMTFKQFLVNRFHKPVYSYYEHED